MPLTHHSVSCYTQVAAEALRVCEALVAVLRPDVAAAVKPQLRPVAGPLFAAVLGRLSAQDQDQEVKECAILCMGAVLGSLGDSLGDEVRAKGQCSRAGSGTHHTSC